MTQPPTSNQIIDAPSKVWQVIIHQSYSDISGLPWDRWSSKWLICEHEGDENIPRTHCHIALVDVKVGAEAIRKLITERGFGGRGQYGIHTVAKESKQPYLLEPLAVYMIKGNLTTIKRSEYTERDHHNWASKWVHRITALKSQDGKLVRETPEKIAPPTKFEIINLLRSRIPDSENSREVIVQEIRKLLVEKKIIIGAWKVLDYYDAFMMYDRPVSFVRGIVEKLNSRGCV